MSTPTSAPTDAAADAAYERIMEIAREHCLVVSAYGGVCALATPAAQRGSDLREKVLRMHQRTETDGAA